MNNEINSKGNILVIDDKPDNLKLLVHILSEQGYQVRPVPNGKLALSGAKAIPPDLILLDIMMPDLDGFEVCKKLKNDDKTKEIPIIFLTAKAETKDIVKGFELGGVDYVTKPFVSAELLARVKTHLKIKNLITKIEHMANHDTLTELPTLRLALDRLGVAISNSKRMDNKVALLFLDLDGFKQVNDVYGHEAGDIVLRSVAQRLLAVIREGDTACRIGGDEFTVLLAGIDNRNIVEEVCQRLIDSIGEKIIYKKTELTVGVSIGVALYPDHASDSVLLRKKADKAMYQVKKSGKNNYMFAEDKEN
jgi:diguanylate cyclase (GGDEF)-like protein